MSGDSKSAVAAPAPAPPAGAEVNILRTVPLHVSSIKINGNAVTETDYIEREFEHARVWQATTFEEVANRTSAAKRELSNSGLFESVDINLDAGPPTSTLGSQAAAGTAAASRPEPTTAITVDVKERKRLGAKAEILTEIQSGERALKLAAKYGNAFGRGEVLEGSVSSSDNFLSRGFDLALTKPHMFGTRNRLRFAVFDQSRDLSRWSSYRYKNRGFNLSLSTPDGRHETAYEANLRDVFPAVAVTSGAHASSIGHEYTASPALLNVSQPASVSLLSHARSSFKSSVRYTYTPVDTRDSKSAPTQGRYIALTSELAGLGGDVDFLKLETEAQQHVPITSTVSFGLSALAGLIRPFSLTRRGNASAAANASGAPAISILDRFFLGGPLLMRGYGPYAVGPKDSHDSLGGDAYSAVGCSLSWLLPFKVTTDYGVRAQLFATAGNLINYDSGSSAGDNFNRWRSGLRSSAGAGLLVPTPLGRFELNIAQPFQADPSDRTQRFQIGLGYKFL